MSKCVAIIFISLLFPTCAAHGATESHYACAATDSNVVLALDVTINDGGGEHVTRLSGSAHYEKACHVREMFFYVSGNSVFVI